MEKKRNTNYSSGQALYRNLRQIFTLYIILKRNEYKKDNVFVGFTMQEKNDLLNIIYSMLYVLNAEAHLYSKALFSLFHSFYARIKMSRKADEGGAEDLRMSKL